MPAETIDYVKAIFKKIDELKKAIDECENQDKLESIKDLLQEVHAETMKFNAITEFNIDNIRQKNKDEKEEKKRQHELALLKLKGRQGLTREIIAYIIGGGGLIFILLDKLFK